MRPHWMILLLVGLALWLHGGLEAAESTSSPALDAAPAAPAIAPAATAVVPASPWQHHTITNAAAQAVLSDYRGAMVSFALRHDHPLQLPHWREGGPVDVTSPLPVLAGFNPSADMNNYLDGLDLPPNPSTEGPWQWTQESDSSGGFSTTWQGLVYTLHYAMDAKRPEVHVHLEVANHRAQAAGLRLRLRALDGIHQDDPLIDINYLKAFVHGTSQEGVLVTGPLAKPGTELSVPVLPSGATLDYLGLKSRFFAAWWTPGSDGVQLLGTGQVAGKQLPYTLAAGEKGYQIPSPAGLYSQSSLIVYLPSPEQPD